MGGSHSKHFAGAAMLTALAGCGVVGPIANPSASRAPFESCGYVAPPPEARQCFTLQRQTVAGEALPMNDGTIAAGEQIRAMPTGAPGCAREHTFATVTGDAVSVDAEGRGKMSMFVFGVGFGLVHRDFDWRAPVDNRSFAVPHIGGPTLNPQGATVRASRGSFRVSDICFKAFHRTRGA